MKTRLRKKILAKRNRISRGSIQRLSKKIARKLCSLHAFQKSKSVLFYVSTQSEVDTQKLIGQLIKEHKKGILVPFIRKGHSLLQVSQLNNFDDLQKGSFGILEPKKAAIKKFDPKKIDLVVVPGIVFDKRGHRIGYGLGYYDRFLKKVRKNAIKIGLAFDFQLVEKIESEGHDVALDMVVTEKRII